MLQVAKSNVFCLVLLLGNLHSVPGESTGSYQPTLCKTRTVTIGEMGVMEFSISPKINMTAVSLMNLRRSNDPAGINLLTCDAMDNKSTIPCHVHNGNFTTKDLTGRTLTVRIPKANNELDGEYELKAFVNGDNIVLSSCNLTVLTTSAYSEPDGPTKVNTIFVPIVLLVVVAAIVIAVVFFLRRRNRNKQSGSRATPENDKLNKTTDTKGLSENDVDA